MFHASSAAFGTVSGTEESFKCVSNECPCEPGISICVVHTPQYPEATCSKKVQKKHTPEFHKIMQKAHDCENCARNETFLGKAVGRNHHDLVESQQNK